VNALLVHALTKSRPPATWERRPNVLARFARAIGAPPEEIDSAMGRFAARAVDASAERTWRLTVWGAVRHEVAMAHEVSRMRREVAARLAAHEAQRRREAAEQEDQIRLLRAEVRRAHGFITASQMWHAYRPTEGWRS
jgi:hypothetical protein